MRGLLLLVLLAAAPAPAQRLRASLDGGWRFFDGAAVGAEAPAFADAAWSRVSLPHTWNADDAFDKAEGYRRGEGWYRRDLTLGEMHRGKRLFLYFEGANQVADVWVNGRHAGQHVGGYTAFSFDVTDLVQAPGRNTLAVRVDNRHDPVIPPLDADFTFYGGLYRTVWLVATEPVHIDLLDHAGPGVYLDTPELTEAAATVRARVRVTNDGTGAFNGRVALRAFDPTGTEVAQWDGPANVAAGQTAVVETTGRVPSPQRWSPEAPNVYRVEAEIQDADGRVRDRVEQPLGFRTMRVDGTGFYLNGTKTTLTGSNRHQDLPGKGNALSDDEHRRDMAIVKDMGFNFVRLAHYPQAPAVLDATDALGLAVWEEIPVVNTITQNETFAANAERMAVEMVKQHYNHPSVVLWGYMNEILLRPPDPLPADYLDDVAALAQRLDDAVKREDASRPTAMAYTDHMVRGGSAMYDPRLVAIPDVIGLNLYFGWYYGTFADLGPFLDAVHAAHPDQGLMVSEYGAGTDERVHARNPVAFDFSVEYGEAFHRASFAQIRARPYLAGSAVWNQFDFGSAGRQDTKNAINQKGLYYFDRTPKDVAFYYQALLRDEPVLRIERDNRHRVRYSQGPPGARIYREGPQTVGIYTNADRVVLPADGRREVEDVPQDGRVIFDANPSRMSSVTVEGLWGGARRVDATTFLVEERGYPSRPGDRVAFNYGAAYSYTDATGIVYESITETSTRTHHRIYGTDDDPLFQAYQEGVEGANMFVANGAYDVALGFMEPNDVQPGDRVFDVTINDQPVIEGLDLAAEAGRWTALTRTIRVDVTDGRLDIRFVPRAGQPILSSLLIRRR